MEKANAIISACDRAGVKLQVVFPFRYGKGLQMVKAAMQRGTFGKILLSNAMCRRYRGQDYYNKSSWRGTWAMDGGGACMNQGIHIIDSYIYLMGPVSSVYAHMGTLGHPGAAVEDVATAVIKFEDGGLGVIEATTCAYPDFGDRIDLHGQKGSVTLAGLPPKVVDWKVVEEKDNIDIEKIPEELELENPYCLHKQVIQDMVEAINEDRPPAINGPEGRKSLEVIHAIYQSAREGREISLQTKS
ncbi:unnamed protein product [marine sediment metagenome]|uniref:GFO/IDH/MocA-like oxidoreductase domain-containing protein n=1 Tax=marine sediment metagenome TaxID=412755 RepID=X1ET92_9ZZZZ